MFSQQTCSVQLKSAWKSELSDENRCFSLVCNYLRPSNDSRQLIFNINAVVLIAIIYQDLRKWLNVYLNLSIVTVFLKNRNFISEIRRSKVTEYAALTLCSIITPFDAFKISCI